MAKVREEALTTRTIIVSTDVFAALWANRRLGEDSENAILERLLGLPKGPPLAIQASAFNEQPRGGGKERNGQDGIYNQLFDVWFPAGFEVFRTYKGRHYSAVVRGGQWIMDGQRFPSLFALSMAIIDSRENPWMHWKYRDATGRPDFISSLRKIGATPEEAASGAEDKTPNEPKQKTARKVAKKARRR